MSNNEIIQRLVEVLLYSILSYFIIMIHILIVITNIKILMKFIFQLQSSENFQIWLILEQFIINKGIETNRNCQLAVAFNEILNNNPSVRLPAWAKIRNHIHALQYLMKFSRLEENSMVKKTKGNYTVQSPWFLTSHNAQLNFQLAIFTKYGGIHCLGMELSFFHANHSRLKIITQ